MQRLFAVLGIVVVLMLIVVGCGGSAKDSLETDQKGGTNFATAAPGRDSFGVTGAAGPSGSGTFQQIQPFATPAPAPTSTSPGLAIANLPPNDGRKVISTANFTIEVSNVSSAMTQIRLLAEGVGGFVDSLSSSGEAEKQSATIVVRVPPAQFYNILEQAERLGKVKARSVSSQDVTDQFIDLDARLKALKLQEQSYLNLLARSQNVSDILTLEREIARVRADIERLQGQLNLLSRRVDFSTIAITLQPPAAIPFDVGQPPSASMVLQVKKVERAYAEIKAYADQIKAKVDGAVLTINDDEKRGFLIIRFFRTDFAQAVSDIEAKGKAVSKEVHDGTTGPGDSQIKEPDARIDIRIEKAPDDSIVWKVVGWTALGLSVVGVGIGLACAYHRVKRPKPTQ